MTENVFNPSLSIDWLTEELQNSIAAHAIESAQTRNGFTMADEDCGIVVRDGDSIELLFCANVHDNPSVHFAIDEALWRSVKDNAIAVFHSHPNRNDSLVLTRSDVRSSQLTMLPILVYHLHSCQWDYYDPRGTHPFPLACTEPNPKAIDHYTQLPFEYGRSDCSTMLSHWFKGWLGVDLKFPYPQRDRTLEEVYQPGWDRMRSEVQRNGFREIGAGEELAIGDVVVMNLSGNPSHCAIVLNPEADMLLHHPGEGVLSRTELYHSEYRSKTDSIWRLAID